jgi:hypothetical protein
MFLNLFGVYSNFARAECKGYRCATWWTGSQMQNLLTSKKESSVSVSLKILVLEKLISLFDRHEGTNCGLN